jgi:hypothetical protein
MRRPRQLKEGVTAAVVATAVGFFAVSSQSLWIDEANSAVKAMATDLPSFFSAMRDERGSDAQMPLYMFLLWAWEKMFGHSEFALRAMNIPVFALALATAMGFWRTTVLRRIFLMVYTCSSAFVWAYLDEARPYILQFLGATACTVALANVASDPAPPRRSDILLFAVGLLLLCGSSLIGVISSLSFVLAFILLWLMRQPIAAIFQRQDFRLAMIFSLPTLLFLATYYSWTLSLGARASSVGSTNVMSVSYAAYELLGMAGLGPGRGDLRVSPMALLPFVFPISVYTFTLGLLLYAGIVVAKRRGIQLEGMQSSVVFWLTPFLVAITTILAGIVGDFRIVGRHLAPLLPFILIFFTLITDSLWRCRPCIAGRAIAILAILATVSSSLAYRFGKHHAKDDYRSAATLALQTIREGGTVWWAADPAGAKYYGIFPNPSKTSDAGERSETILVSNLTSAQLCDQPEPQLIVLSKVDIYDSGQSLQEWTQVHPPASKVDKTAFQLFIYGHRF